MPDESFPLVRYRGHLTEGCDMVSAQVWADGFGTWHVRVPNTPDAYMVARDAMRDALTARVRDVAPACWTNLVYVRSGDGSVTYREGVPFSPEGM